MDCLVRVLTIVLDNTIAILQVHALSNLSCNDHHVPEHGLITIVYVHKRILFMRLCQDDEVNRGTRVFRWKNNHTFVFKKDILSALFTIDNFVERRLLKLFKCDFRFLHLRLDLPVFRLGSPAAHSEYWAGLAKLRENQVAVFVETCELLTQSTSERERLDLDFKDKDVIASLHQLSEIRDSSDILFQENL